ncbi:MAG: DUF2071 domain-containing protein, partial [Ginsengibacter sp.]
MEQSYNGKLLCTARSVPYKTQLDSFNEKTYISLVGFMFLNTRIMGFGLPYYINFEEVNLQFYVKH